MSKNQSQSIPDTWVDPSAISNKLRSAWNFFDLSKYPRQALEYKIQDKEKPEGLDSPTPFTDPLDYLPVEKLGAMALPLMAGTLWKAPFNEYARVMAGQHPLELDPKNLMNFMSDLGPSIRTKNAEAIGAQAIDEFGGITDPKKLIELRLAKQGVEQPKGISIQTLPGGITGGSYSPHNKNISLYQVPGEFSPQHPDAELAGAGMHEAQHAIESQGLTPLQIRNNYKPEALLDSNSSRSNRNLEANSFFDPHRIAEVMRYSAQDPNLFSKLPYWVQNAISQGHSPDMIANLFKDNSELQASMGLIFRAIGGNAKPGSPGFNGTDHYLEDIWGSLNHFNKFKGESEMGPYYLAKNEIKSGGGDNIDPSWIDRFPDLKDDLKNRPSPIRSLENFTPKKLSIWDQVKPTQAAAAGFGGTMLAGSILKGDSSPKTQAETHPEDQEPQDYNDDPSTMTPDQLNHYVKSIAEKQRSVYGPAY